ncbi:MAG: CHAT domain-containing protein [Bacteroidia bacterium]
MMITLLLLSLSGSLLATPPSDIKAGITEAKKLEKEKKWTESMAAYEAVMDQLRANQDTGNHYFLDCLQRQGAIAFFNLEGQMPTAIEKFEQAIQLYERHKLTSSTISTAGAFLGYYYVFMSDKIMLEKALSAYQKTISLFPKDSLPNRNLMICYKEIGSVWARKGDFEQGIQYHKRGIHLRESAPYNPELYNTGIRDALASNYEFVRRFDKAQVIYEALLKQKNLMKSKIPHVMMGLGECYIHNGELDKAQDIADRAIKIVLNYFEGDSAHYEVISAIDFLATVAGEKGESKKAIEYAKKSLKLSILSELHGPEGRPTAKRHFWLGDYYLDAGYDSLALASFHRSLQTFAPYFKSEDIYEVPVLNEDDRETWVVSCLRKKAKQFLIYHDQTGDRIWAQRALDHVSAAIAQQEKIIFSLRNQGNRVQALEEDYPTYLYGMKACYILFDQTKQDQYLAKAFQIMEQGKAMILHQQSTIGSAASKVGNIARMVDSLEQQIAQLRIQSKDSTQSNEDTDRLLAETTVEIDLLKVKAEAQDPALKNYLLRQSAPILLAQVQQRIMPVQGHALLHYFMTDSAIFTLVLSGDQTLLHRTKLDKSFLDRLKAMGDIVKQIPEVEGAKSQFISYKDHAYFLYQKLIEEPVLQNGLNPKHLTIIPHGILNTIPFGALISDKSDKITSYKALPYLIKSHSISYTYSATSLLQNRPQDIPFKALAISPLFEVQNSTSPTDSVRDGLNPLAWTLEEAQRIYNIYGGKLLVHEDATEHNFKKLFDQFGIIHIASHALLDEATPELSRILFTMPTDMQEDGSLFLEEVFGMDFRNKLICLSACNTGQGKLTQGDGLMSLARGFQYAGSPSLMATMWQAQDRSSYMISTQFHEKIAAGKRLDEAMQLSQKQYLNQADALKAHPYYWAHMVIIGETKLPIYNGSSMRLFKIACFIFLVLGLSWMIGKQSTQQQFTTPKL